MNPSLERRALVVLLAVLAVEIVAAVLLHRDGPELRADAGSGGVRDRVGAIHVLMNRRAGPPVDDAFVRDLLASSEPLLRELAYTPPVTRRAGLRMQGEALRERPRVDPESRRCAFHLAHPFEGGAPRMKAFEVRQYLRDARR